MGGDRRGCLRVSRDDVVGSGDGVYVSRGIDVSPSSSMAVL